MADEPTAELSRALRAAWLAVEETRGDLLRLAAQVVALTEELEHRGGADDPEIAARLEARAQALLPRIQMSDLQEPGRLHLGDFEDKYEVATDDGPPCHELLPLCEARCCSFVFALSSQDLDEGVIRWDHGRPYLIRQEADGYCTHLARGTGCTVYAQRPAPCRKFDCRNDPRVWIDYQRRIVAPRDAVGDPPEDAFELRERVRRRELALTAEAWALRRR
jgi:Fe-S-cluster containining protein